MIIGGSASPGLIIDGAISLQTRLRGQIENHICWAISDAGAKLEAARLRRVWSNAKHRDVGPCQTYNCHGLTFASRRTAIWKPTEVEKILSQDGYKIVSQDVVEAGDIVIYRKTPLKGGEIQHSGIVVESNKSPDMIGRNVKILSKWGFSQEVIHDVRYCEYFEDVSIEYYRIEK